MIYDCLRQSFESDPNQSNEYLSLSNVINLELIFPSPFNDDDMRFSLFFTSLTRKSPSGRCHDRSYFDCEDLYCIHSSARCNHLVECRTARDELSCEIVRSRSSEFHSHQSIDSLIIYSLSMLVYILTHAQSLF